MANGTQDLYKAAVVAEREVAKAQRVVGAIKARLDTLRGLDAHHTALSRLAWQAWGCVGNTDAQNVRYAREGHRHTEQAEEIRRTLDRVLTEEAQAVAALDRLDEVRRQTFAALRAVP